MQINLTMKSILALQKKLPNSSEILPPSVYRSRPENEIVELNIDAFSLDSLEILRAVMQENGEKQLRTVTKLVKNLSDPSTTRLRSLQDAPDIIKAFFQQQEYPWVFSLNDGQKAVAYLPVSVEFHRETSSYRNQSYVRCTFAYTTKGESKEYSFNFDNLRYEPTVTELLRQHHLVVADPDLMELYTKYHKRYTEFLELHGEQFYVRGNAYSKDDNYWWQATVKSLMVKNRPSKAVLDLEEFASRTSRLKYSSRGEVLVVDGKVNTAIFNEPKEIPNHPVLPVFSLYQHETFWVNVANMNPYKYETDLKSKLVLPPSHEKLIGALVSNLEVLRQEAQAEDKSRVMREKSQSSIILSKGPPGTGKTLTAEVYAEEIQRPLYEVPGKELGVNPEEIEDNLGRILQRAVRLRMPILINEADVFIQERGNDINQNAVVSVFLRLLEYHNGLVFLTSNRENIDDAVSSRCIAEITYDLPGPTERRKLWEVQLREFNVELSDSDVKKLSKTFPSVAGRDIQNLIRLTSRVCKAHNEEFSLQALKDCAPFRSIEVAED